MTPTTSQRNRDEIARRGQEIYDRVVKPRLTPADDGKLVAIDTVCEDFEIDADDYNAVMRLRDRQPTAEMWLLRVGYSAAYQLRSHR